MLQNSLRQPGFQTRVPALCILLPPTGESHDCSKDHCWLKTTARLSAETVKIHQLNSVTGEEERLEAVLPLVKKHGAAVIAICNDETGISEDPDVRFAVAKKIIERAADHGIAKEDVIIDPLMMPIGALPTAGRQIFQLLQRIREELGVNTTGGASNVSFGMPNRHAINAHFLSMAIAHGLTSAITNTMEEALKQAIMAGDLLLGHDENAMAWIRANRKPVPVNGERGHRGRRPRPAS